MASLGSPTLRVSVPADFPSEIVLPVQTEKDGRIWPGAGTVWSKLLDARTLIALGVDVRWRKADGSYLDRDEALRLIDANEEAARNGHSPDFTQA